MSKDNVIRLCDARRKKRQITGPILYYLTDSAQWLETLNNLRIGNIVDIDSAEQLERTLLTAAPDLIFMESNISWAEPIHTIEWVTGLLHAPVVMICDPKTEGEVIKQAYAAGAHDVLYSPLNPDEAQEALGVLLKLSGNLSLHQ